MSAAATMSVALRGVMEGPPLPGRVLAVFPRALYLDLDRPVAPGAPSLLSAVSHDGIPHPNSIVLARTSTARPFAGCRTGVGVTVGRGRLVVTTGPPGTETGTGGVALELRATRWWQPRPILVPVPAAALAARARRLRSLLHELVDVPAELGTLVDPVWLVAAAERLVGALLAQDAPAAEAAGRALIGRGPGLTPAGDDVLCSLFATALLLAPIVQDAPGGRGAPGRDGAATAETSGVVPEACGVVPEACGVVPEACGVVPEACGAVPGRGAASDTMLSTIAVALAEAARDRTTAVSAALLWYASRGHATGPLADLLRTLSAGGALADDLRRLVAVGSTSGRDLAIGVAAGLDLILAPRPAPARGPRPVHRPPTVRPVTGAERR